MVASRILEADQFALWTEEVSVCEKPSRILLIVDLPETSETGEGKAAASLGEDFILHVQLLPGVGLCSLTESCASEPRAKLNALLSLSCSWKRNLSARCSVLSFCNRP